MRIAILMGHRKEDYEGQYGPEVMVACDEFTMDENPEWFAEQSKKEKEIWGSELDAAAVINIEVDTDLVMDALYPSRNHISAKIID